MKDQGRIISKIIQLCPRFFPLCFFLALLKAISALSLVILPTLLLEEMTTTLRVKYLLLWAGLCICIPHLLLTIITFVTKAIDDSAEYIENELELSIDRVNMEVRYSEFENPEIHKIFQKIKDGKNMVGPVTGLYRSYAVTIVQYVFNILLYLPFLGNLIFTDAAPVNYEYLRYPIPILTNFCRSTPLFLFCCFALCGITIWLHYRFQDKTHRLVEQFSDVERAYQYYTGIRADYENGADIRLNKLDAMLQLRLKKYYQDEKQMYFSIGSFQGKSNLLLSIFHSIQTLLIYGFVIGKTIFGMITIGGFYLYVNALNQILRAMTEIVRQSGELRVAIEYYKGYGQLWSREKGMDFEHKQTWPDAPCGTIVFENVSFRYPGSEKWVLRNINLSIQPGEKIAIVGKNGAGKTTLIKLLVGLYPLEFGHIYIDGQDIHHYDHNQLFAMFRTVFQDYRLIATSVANNISIFDKHPDFARMKRLLRDIGFQCDTQADLLRPVSRRLSGDGILFSGGEEQKIAIARALYQDAPYYIMDEPSAALDPIAEKEINERMLQISRERTLIVISHRLTTCSMVDRVIVLDNGEVKEDGKHHELLEKQGLYAHMWNAQAKYYQ